MSVLDILIVVAVTALGGAINSIAGGGTLLTFPALVGLGIPPLVANATSTVALLPASLSAMWGYRKELRGAERWAVRFAIPSLAGGAAGALLLLRTPPDRFDAIAPWLVLGATALFMARGLVERAVARGRRQRRGDEAAAGEPETPPATFLVYQFLVGVYGGYFGAGIGILMLAALSLMGLTNIHRMNGLKNWGGLCMNLVAASIFVARGIVHWPVALSMAVGAVLGGYGGARLAQRVPQVRVRQAIVAIGLASTLYLLWITRSGRPI